MQYDLPESGDIPIKITNEALETHYIDAFHLLAVSHPETTRVYQTNDDTFIQISNEIPFPDARTSEGKDISSILMDDDGVSHRSDTRKFLELRTAPVKDWIEVSGQIKPGTKKAKVLIKYRNTLLTTVLLYDVVIASQGIGALEWTRRMNEDRLYAAQFKAVYDLFSGVAVECKQNGQWIETGKFQDAGPINWKYTVTEVPVEADGKINVRLNFIPDNIMIDYIAFDTTSCEEPLTIKTLAPVSITNYTGADRSDLARLLEQDDDACLITNPGDSYMLQYHYAPVTGKRITFFIASKGYYNEWIRGNWITETNDDYSFDLYDVRGTFNKLVDSWLENKDLLEQEFFHTRIPLKEAK